MAPSGRKNNFTWNDGEIELLLHVLVDKKMEKTGEGVDLDSVKQNYEENATRLMKSISKTPGKIFQRDQSKLRKQIKLNYLKVVTSGRQSGGCRVVRNLAPSFYNANCAKNCTVKVFTRVHQKVEPYQKTF